MADLELPWAASLDAAEPGQYVWVSNGQSGHHAYVSAVEITKRGRTLLTTTRGQTFRITDGRDSKHTSRTGGPPYTIYTEATRQIREQRAAAARVIRDAGLEFRLGASWPDKKVLALAAWLEEHP